MSAIVFSIGGNALAHFKPVNAITSATSITATQTQLIAIEQTTKGNAQSGATLHHFSHSKPSLVTRSFTPERVTSLASAAPFVIAGGVSGVCFVWDEDDGVLAAAPRCHHRKVNTVAFSPDGALFATGGDDAVVHVWSLAHVLACGAEATPTEAAPLVTFAHHALPVTGAAFGETFPSPDGVLASVSADRCINIHSVHAGQLLRSVRTPAPLTCVCVCACDAVVAAGAEDGAVYVVTLVGSPSDQSGAVRLVGHPGAIRSLAAVPYRGCIVSACAGGTVRVWDVTDAARGEHDPDTVSATSCVSTWTHAANAAATGGSGGGGAVAAEGVECSSVLCMPCPADLRGRLSASRVGTTTDDVTTFAAAIGGDGGGGINSNLQPFEKYSSVQARQNADRILLRIGACDDSD
ncbi:pre-rRNA-processing protein IPI3 [Pycnococcus provasolii]